MQIWSNSKVSRSTIIGSRGHSGFENVAVVAHLLEHFTLVHQENAGPNFTIGILLIVCETRDP